MTGDAGTDLYAPMLLSLNLQVSVNDSMSTVTCLQSHESTSQMTSSATALVYCVLWYTVLFGGAQV